MSDIKTGFWQNIFNGSYINVRSTSHVSASEVLYSEEGCGIVHRMSVKELTDSYEFRGSIEAVPVVDDTFNDDTPAQTFGDVSNHVSSTPFEPIKVDSFSKKYMTNVPNVWRNAGKMRLIGIAGQARAGKDTLASYMLDNLDGEWSRSSFADPLKAMLNTIGIDCSDDKKTIEDNDYGVSPRYMMQTLGTEWGRNLIDGDIWVKAFARLNAGKCVIVPDVRFENEADLVREHGVLIHLVGRGGIEGNHVSENSIEFKPGDIVIDNSRDLAWLHAQVDGNAVLDNFVGGL